MSAAVLGLLVLGIVVILFVWNRVEVAAIGSAMLPHAVGAVDLDQAVAGFGDPTVAVGLVPLVWSF